MKQMPSKLTPLFNQEILRVAKKEKKTDDKSMKVFLEELAALCGVGLRMIYHWRSGSTKLPAEHLPVLCRRFGSNTLLTELTRLSAETQIENPDDFDLARLAARSVRDDLAVYERFLADFESDGIQPGEMIELRELGARIHGNVHRLLEIAEADCARRLTANAPPRKGSAKAEVRGQRVEVRKQIAR